MRSVIGAAVALSACGGASTQAGTAASQTGAAATDARGAALAPVEVHEPEGVEIEGVTIGPEGRATPYGVSGGDPIATLDGPTLDPTYAFAPQNPARVGGARVEEDPESGERAFLNALWGPQGQPISYQRLGSCCPLPDTGMLDAFELTYEGLEGDPLVLYLDPYHCGRLNVPVGLRAAPPETGTAAR